MSRKNLTRQFLMLGCLALTVQPAFAQSLGGAGAVSSATGIRTDAAVRAANRAAADAAVRSANRAAADAAVRSANRAAADAAADAAVRSANRSAADAAVRSATSATADAAVRAATRASADAATRSATRTSTNAATRFATGAAVRSAGRSAADAATQAAGRTATSSATRVSSGLRLGARTRNSAVLSAGAALGSSQRSAGSIVDLASRATTDANARARAQGSFATGLSASLAGRSGDVQARARFQLRERLAQIDRMRDQAVETGNTVLLETANRLEADAHARFRADVAINAEQNAAFRSETNSSAEARASQENEFSAGASQRSQSSSRFNARVPDQKARSRFNLFGSFLGRGRVKQSDRGARASTAGSSRSFLRGRLDNAEESRQRQFDLQSRQTTDSRANASAARSIEATGSGRTQLDSEAGIRRK